MTAALARQVILYAATGVAVTRSSARDRGSVIPWPPRNDGPRRAVASVDAWQRVGTTSAVTASMPRRRSHVFVTVIAAAMFAGGAAPLHAQSVEVAPFGGVRFGGGLFEASTGRPVDTDGAPAVGVTVDIPWAPGLQIEAAFSHQSATVHLPGQPLTPSARAQVTVDHWQGGGLQEYGTGRARPFLTGVLGLTRFASGGDNEVRFTAGAGGGVKIFPAARLGVRLDGRVFATLLDADGTALACVNQTCLLSLHVNVVWQAELTAGLVVRLR